MTSTLLMVLLVSCLQEPAGQAPHAPGPAVQQPAAPDNANQPADLGDADDELNAATRKWTSKDGNFSTLGEYQEFKDGLVVIKKLPEGKILKLKPSDLSDEDMDWVKDRVAEIKAARPPKYQCKRCRDRQVVKCPIRNCRGGQIFDKVPVTHVVQAGGGFSSSTSFVDKPVGKCKYCNGTGVIPCPQCQARNYADAQSARAQEEALRNRDHDLAASRRAELQALRDKIDKLELERKVRDLEGVEKAGGRTGKEQMEELDVLRAKLKTEMQRLDVEEKQQRLDKAKRGK